MAKSCVDISDMYDPMTFFHLDVLANGLIRDTYSLHHEFLTKLKFLKDWQIQLVNNECQIFKIDSFLKTLQLNMKATEEEIEQLECGLTKCNKIVDNMDIPECHYCDRPTRKSEQVVFLELLKNTSFKITRLWNFTSDVEAIVKYFGVKPSAYDIIIRILNYHNQILSNTERNLDLILDKLLIISTILRYHQK